ncbi:three-Cys-motif partner protein TcmP [Sphingopyxis alaskensis]|jgi:three-Cys-motif partner protein|uniref:three-Cys-motif partner protein TcmP n=1 Tax=Sphingopyxis alaskensis TaxID=117207 RepID=UPI002040BA3C|nr:three-Cys-motif partner protein TcmP [Sphingopyxis alaskensis]MCM3419484.1 three-Cys-motif partner protein TcmP [Sphingopyxis alaskensis]
MAIDSAHYIGREQALVKHTFLDRYLPALIGKVCSRYDEFVYVDGFAGPWQSAAGESFDDTSFGIALTHMTAQRLLYLSKGRNIRMRAFLVEKDPSSFAQLERAIARFPKIEIIPLNGLMEAHAARIASCIPQSAFSFTLIDPKGFPDIGAMLPLLKREHAEALVNFMFDFANRFAGTDLIPALEDWLSALGSVGWRQEVEGLSGSERERKLERLAAEALQITGAYSFSPVITVDKVLHNRPLYKLIFLSRHAEGLKVFRDSEAKALDTQATARSASKAKKRAESSPIGDLFADGEDAVPNDRSSQVIRQSRQDAIRALGAQIMTAGSSGMVWGNLWPPILEDFSVTRSWLGHQVNDMRKAGRILAPGWPSERKQIPEDSQRLILAQAVSPT